MGGIGSGNREARASRATVAEYRKIDVRRWARDGLLRPGHRFTWQWSYRGTVEGSISVEVEDGRVILDYRAGVGGAWEQMRYPVELAETACHMGGARQWFICPARDCGRRVALLYGGRMFACRTCHGLTYPSQREDASDRAARRAGHIRDRLGWVPGILNGPGGKPKGMHWRTFDRLRAEHDRHVEQSCALMLRRLGATADADWLL